jgi:2-polyprenyl-3-methyl-5-hydroxy-6-metoxy-1,4-benzoquinol methylase
MNQGVAQYDASSYWEQRARRFAAQGDGLAAVCAYGMPSFYNWQIHCSQYLALRPWLQPHPGTRVLDIGCGVGRWSRLLAARGAHVTGIDLSPTMITIARQRTESVGLSERCRYMVQDLAQLDAGGPYDLILGVTVLQHILDPARLRRALSRMAAHLAPGGRMVLLEAAPAQATRRCDNPAFVARSRDSYLELYRSCGMRVRRITGVDPAPFKIWLLPYLSHVPRAFGRAAVAAASMVALPFDALFGRCAVRNSWHVVFVLEHDGEDTDGD